MQPVELRRVRTLYACVGEHETELSFEPNQIISNGKYPERSNSEHLHNLRQLSRMDIDDYPLPSARTSTPLNSGQKGKGIGK